MYDLDHVRCVLGKHMICPLNLDELLGVIGSFENVEGVLEGNNVILSSVDDQPGDPDRRSTGNDGADGHGVVDESLRQRARRLIPHEARTRCDVGELALRERVRMDHAG